MFIQLKNTQGCAHRPYPGPLREGTGCLCHSGTVVTSADPAAQMAKLPAQGVRVW